MLRKRVYFSDLPARLPRARSRDGAWESCDTATRSFSVFLKIVRPINNCSALRKPTPRLASTGHAPPRHVVDVITIQSRLGASVHKLFSLLVQTRFMSWHKYSHTPFAIHAPTAITSVRVPHGALYRDTSHLSSRSFYDFFAVHEKRSTCLYSGSSMTSQAADVKCLCLRWRCFCKRNARDLSL